MNQHFSEFALKLFLSHQQQKLLFSFLFLLLIMNFALFLLELYLLQLGKKSFTGVFFNNNNNKYMQIAKGESTEHPECKL